jgi:LysM repeat protein
VEVEVLRFDGELDINAILDARWAIFREQNREMLFIEKSSISEAVSGQGYEAFVSSQSRAIWELSRQIAGEIARISNPVAEASRASEKALSQTKMLYHEVRRGDTLSRISKKYGVSVDEICRLNNTTKEKIIYPGQKILIAPGKKQ